MSSVPNIEFWLRGPVDGVAPVLQPAAHAVLQAQEDVATHAPTLTVDELWRSRGRGASAGFHLLHLAGALDRLFTYARGEQLTEAQFAAMRGERRAEERDGIQDVLVAEFDAAVERALAQVRATDPATLLEPREVGRARLPSTVIGLLFHAAEHTQRHVGQLVTTSKIVRGG